MTQLSERDLEIRVRASLKDWGAGAPLGEDRLGEIIGFRRRRAIAVLAVAAVTVGAMLTTALLYREQEPQPTVAGPAPAPSRIVVGDVPGVRVLAADGDDVWLMSSGDRKLFRLNADRAGVTDSIDVDGYFEGLAVTDGIAWLAGYEPNRVVAIDTSTGREMYEVPLAASPHGIRAAFGAIWVSGGEHLTRIDPSTGRGERIPIGRPTGFFDAGSDALWVAEADGTELLEIDPTDHRIVSSLEVGVAMRAVRAAPDGTVWVTIPDDDQVVAIDPVARRVQGRVAVGDWPSALEVVGDHLWVSDMRDGTVTVVALEDLSVTSYAAGSVPGSVVGAGGKAFVSLHRESSVLVFENATPYPQMPPVSLSTESEPRSGLYLRCRGTGETTVVIVPDPVHDAGSFASFERELSGESRVCRTVFPQQPARPDVLASELRHVLERPALPQSFLLVGHGFGGLVARELAATWDPVVGLMLLDANTLAPEETDNDAVVTSLIEQFELVERLQIGVPVVVATSDPGAPADPRNGTAETRKQFLFNQQQMAIRLGASIVVVEGDAWVPTYRPGAVVDEIVDLLALVAGIK